MIDAQPHVAFFLRYLGGGGAERVLLNLASGLSQQGIQVELVLENAWGPHLSKVPDEVKIVDLKASGTLSAIGAFAQYLRQVKPLAVLSALHYANEIAIAAKKLSGVTTRLIVSEHNTLSQALPQKSGLKKRLLPSLIRMLYPWADGVVAVSHGVAQDLARMTGLSPDLITTIYNPVIMPDLPQKAAAPVDHPWFAEGEPPVVVGVGKLEKQKDFTNLIQAFALVRQQCEARLMILGWGPLRSQLEALVTDLGLENDVALLGYIENPYPYMAKASVFALSSAWEGLPTVLIEAMAVGTPVVSTDCPSGPQEILDGGKYGILTPVQDSSALAEGILTVLKQPTPAMPKEWLEQFTLTATTQNYLKIFHLDPRKSE
ncbi:MAG: glycosyltransferase [Kamptonema sp. SIO4C4]|nr:glycosyltransferase [Kamptonema sp. SIO4C4]